MSGGGDAACWAHLVGDERPLSAIEVGELLAAGSPDGFRWDGEAFVKRLDGPGPAPTTITVTIEDGAGRRIEATGPAEVVPAADGTFQVRVVPATFEATIAR